MKNKPHGDENTWKLLRTSVAKPGISLQTCLSGKQQKFTHQLLKAISSPLRWEFRLWGTKTTTGRMLQKANKEILCAEEFAIYV